MYHTPQKKKEYSSRSWWMTTRKLDFPETTGQLYVALQQLCQYVHHLHMFMPENNHGMEGGSGQQVPPSS